MRPPEAAHARASVQADHDVYEAPGRGEAPSVITPRLSQCPGGERLGSGGRCQRTTAVGNAPATVGRARLMQARPVQEKAWCSVRAMISSCNVRVRSQK